MSLTKDVNDVKQSSSSTNNSTSSFSYNRKKKIVSDIEKLKNKEDYIALFKIINRVTDKYTQNKNGVFINLNCLNDSTLLEIETFLNNNKDKFKTENTIEQLTFTPNMFKSTQPKTISSMKLTNYEKNVIKRHRDFCSEQSSESEFYTS